MLTLAAAGLLLAGCAPEDAAEPGGPDDPGQVVTEPDPVGLIGSWTLSELAGGAGDSVIQLGAASEVRVWRDCAILSGTWRADSYGQFVAYIAGHSDACGGASATVPEWLSRATSYDVDGEARLLYDEAGELVARLEPGAEPTPGPDMAPDLVEPPVVTDEARRALAPAAPLPSGLTPAEPDALVGRWVPADGSSGGVETPFVELAGDGSWQGSDGCNGTSGRWLAGPEGAVVAVTGPTTLIGCDNVQVGSWLAGASRAGFDAEVLVLLDAQGAELGRLQPA